MLACCRQIRASSTSQYSLSISAPLQVSHIFHVAICFITIFDKDLAVVLSAYGMGGPRFFARHKTMGAWAIVPEAKQLLVVEDMLDDARLRTCCKATCLPIVAAVFSVDMLTSA